MIPSLVALLMLAGPVRPDPVFVVQDPRIDEASGMVDLGDGLTVLTNDSGDTGRVFVLDRAGRTVGVTEFGAALDAEALAPAGPGRVWVGDIGDNRLRRPYVVLHRVPVGRGERRVTVPAYRLAYPDGPHDAETLLRHPRTDRLFVVTKGILGGAVYAVPHPLDADRVNRLRKLANVSIYATDGAFLADGRRVLIRGYGSATLYSFPDWKILSAFRLPREPQGESLSVGPGDRIRITSEGLRQPVLPVALPAAPRRAASATPPARADDSTGSDPHHERMGSGTERTVFAGVFAAIAAGLVAMAGIALRRRSRR